MITVSKSGKNVCPIADGASESRLGSPGARARDSKCELTIREHLHTERPNRGISFRDDELPTT